MSNFNKVTDKDVKAIYERLANAWEMASIDRECTFKEAVFIPITGDHAEIGGAIFIAVLCYPESVEKQYKLVKAIATGILKKSTKPKSSVRKELRENPALAEMLDTPNKRIEQTLNKGSERLHKRFRAAWVLCKKAASNADPSDQKSLKELVLITAKQNTKAYPAFFTEKVDGDDDQIFDSFRQRIMTPSKPVAHLAMSLFLYLETEKITNISIFELVQSANEWLPSVVEKAEMLRVMFGDIFPRHDSQYVQGRWHNFDAPPSETIAILPFIDPIDPSTGWSELMNRRIPGQIK